MNTMNRCNPIPRAVALALIGSGTFGFATIAAAADQFGVPKATIRYGDLNLKTAKGIKVLYQRIVSASYAVCQSFDRDRYDNADPLSLEDCRRKIIADAVARIDKPALYSLARINKAKPTPAPIVTSENRR